jgi:hypothetical protein
MRKIYGNDLSQEKYQTTENKDDQSLSVTNKDYLCDRNDQEIDIIELFQLYICLMLD